MSVFMMNVLQFKRDLNLWMSAIDARDLRGRGLRPWM